MKNILTGFILLSAAVANAQDPQFSQFFANPLYHNPAFTGESGTTRMIVTARKQWAGLGDGYNSYAASVDSYVKSGMSIGMQISRDEQFKTFSSTIVSGLYSYIVPLNDQNVLQLGAQPSWYFNRIGNLSDLRFVDRFSASPNQVTISPSQDPLALGGPLSWNHFDFSVGVLWKHSQTIGDIPMVWAGATWHHMKFERNALQPPGRLGLQAGFKLPHNMNFLGNNRVRDNEKEKSISFTSYFRKQGRFSQLDTGLNLHYQPMIFGIWYRNIPLKKYKDISQRDALTFITGIQVGKFLFEYSYDLTVSSLSRDSQGSNEITIWYGFDSFLDLNIRGMDARRKLKCTNF